jgi:hypothetical protein
VDDVKVKLISAAERASACAGLCAGGGERVPHDGEEDCGQTEPDEVYPVAGWLEADSGQDEERDTHHVEDRGRCSAHDGNGEHGVPRL